MFPLLYKYLMLHDQVCIPGVGRFYKQRNVARHDFVNKAFQPPVHSILFREEPVKADKQFFSFLSNERGLDSVEVVRHFHDFSYRLSNHIRLYQATQLPGLGVISKGSDGSLAFQAEELLANYYTAVPAEVVGRNGIAALFGHDPVAIADETAVILDDTSTKSKSWWWIIAILLALIAIGAIVFYYVQNGNLRF